MGWFAPSMVDQLKETNRADSVSFFNESKVFRILSSLDTRKGKHANIFNKIISRWIKFQESTMIQVSLLIFFQIGSFIKFLLGLITKSVNRSRYNFRQFQWNFLSSRIPYRIRHKLIFKNSKGILPEPISKKFNELYQKPISNTFSREDFQALYKLTKILPVYLVRKWQPRISFQT